MPKRTVLLFIVEDNNVEFRRFLFAPEQTLVQTIEAPVIWDAIAHTMASL